MFTGIVEEFGEVVRLERGRQSARLSVRGPLVTSDASRGSSIAVSGVCLTVVGQDGDVFTADVMQETLDRTALGDLAPGDRVNLERPLAADGRFGGHIVQGHVDGTGRVVDRVPGDRWETVRVAVPASLAPYLVEKGSLAVDGVSLTVAGVADTPDGPVVTVCLIPETLSRTTLGIRQPPERVNLEVDVLAKYVQRMLSGATDRDPAGTTGPADLASGTRP
jgi:riboflavin synthase